MRIRPDAGSVKSIAFVLTLVAFALRVFRLGAQSLWYDEVFAVTVSRMPFPDWLRFLFEVDGSHPPGFFFIMSLWTQLGTEEFIVRFLSVSTGTLSVAAIYAIGAKSGNRWVGILAAGLLALSPYDVWYSQEARMYAPLVLFALLSSLFFLLLVARVDWRVTVALTIASIGGLYFNYLFPLVLLSQLFFLILKRRQYRAALGNWLIANFVAGILFLPWFAAVLTSGGFARADIAWIPPARWYDPVISLYTLIVGTTNNPMEPFNWVAPLLFAAAAAFAIRRAMRGPWRDSIAYSLLWLLIPFGIVFLISLPVGAPNKRSLYSDRYLLEELPALLLLVSFGGVQLFQTNPRILVAGLALAMTPLLISLAGMYANPAYARDDWRAASAYVAANADPLHDQLALEASLTWPYSYYDRSQLSRIPFYEDSTLLAEKLNKDLNPDSSQLWLVTATIPGSAHRLPMSGAEQLAVAKRDLGKSVLDRRYQIESERLFQGILVTAYRIKP